MPKTRMKRTTAVTRAKTIRRMMTMVMRGMHQRLIRGRRKMMMMRTVFETSM